MNFISKKIIFQKRVKIPWNDKFIYYVEQDGCESEYGIAIVGSYVLITQKDGNGAVSVPLATCVLEGAVTGIEIGCTPIGPIR